MEGPPQEEKEKNKLQLTLSSALLFRTLKNKILWAGGFVSKICRGVLEWSVLLLLLPALKNSS